MTHVRFDEDAYWEGGVPPHASPGTDGPPTLRVARFQLTEDRRGPTALVLDMAAGHVLNHHAHDCERFEIVISGSLDVGDGRPLGPGDVMTAKPGEFYGPHIAGSEGCVTLEVFSSVSGIQPLYEVPPEEQARRRTEAQSSEEASDSV